MLILLTQWFHIITPFAGTYLYYTSKHDIFSHILMNNKYKFSHEERWFSVSKSHIVYSKTMNNRMEQLYESLTT
jgi:hypothetical protein